MKSTYNPRKMIHISQETFNRLLRLRQKYSDWSDSKIIAEGLKKLEEEK